MESDRDEGMEVPLSNGGVALVSPCDYEMVMRQKWFRNVTRLGTTYAQGAKWDGERNRSLLMHRLIMDAPAGKVVDHINGNGLDNRRSNLRVVTRSENVHNSKGRGGASGYKGVSFVKLSQKWRASITVRGVLHNLGLFVSPVEAAKAYDAAAVRLVGECAGLNFPDERPISRVKANLPEGVVAKEHCFWCGEPLAPGFYEIADKDMVVRLHFPNCVIDLIGRLARDMENRNIRSLLTLKSCTDNEPYR